MPKNKKSKKQNLRKTQNSKKKHNKNMRRTHKGGFSLFSSTKPSPSTQAINPVANATTSVLTQNAKDIAETAEKAALIGAVAVVAKTVIVGLTTVGLVSPAGPAIAVLLLVAHELAEIYKANKNLNKLMYDVMNIVSNCYRLNELIDKSVQVFFIYIFNHTALSNQIEFNDVNAKTKTLIGETSVYKDLFSAAQTYAKKRVDEYNNSTNKSTFIFAPNDVLQKNNITDSLTLIGKLKKNADIDSRLYDKIKRLTLYLLDLSPTPMLTRLNNDKNIHNSGFGKLLQIEMQKRNTIMSKTFSSANRFYKRTVSSKITTDKIVQELSVINGYYNLMKSQYDFQMDYYSRELLPVEYKKIWNFIERQDEYIYFMVPPDVNSATSNIIANERSHLNELPTDMYNETIQLETSSGTNDEIIVDSKSQEQTANTSQNPSNLYEANMVKP